MQLIQVDDTAWRWLMGSSRTARCKCVIFYLGLEWVWGKSGSGGSNQTDMMTLDDFRTSCGGNAEDLTILSGKSVSMLSLKTNWKSHEMQEISRTHQTAWSTGFVPHLFGCWQPQVCILPDLFFNCWYMSKRVIAAASIMLNQSCKCCCHG